MRLFAKLAIGLCCLFVITILMMVASAFVAEKSPILDFLDRFGIAVIGLECAAILFALLGARFEPDTEPADSASSSSQPSSSELTAPDRSATEADIAAVTHSDAASQSAH